MIASPQMILAGIFVLFPASVPQTHSPGKEATNQVCESGRYRPPLSRDCIIFYGAHTPSLAHSTSADSIMMGAETAAAGSVMLSLNSSALLTPGLGFWVQKPPSLWRKIVNSTLPGYTLSKR